MRAPEIVRSFRQLRALIIGDAMLDSYLEGNATRLCSEGPVPVVRKSSEEHVPGGAANTAANLRALGAQVCFLGLVGKDAAGELLRQALRRRDVDDRWLVDDDRVATLHKQRILSDEQYVVRFDAGDAHNCSQSGREKLLTNLADAYEHCDLVVVSDYCYGTVSVDLIQALRGLRMSHPVVLAIDSKGLLHFKEVGATVVTPNHLEARLALEPASRNESHGDIEEAEHIGKQLFELMDTEYIAITMAEAGVLVLHRTNEPTYLPAHAVSRPNDIGAGDSFTASMALSLAAGASGVEAARIGVDAGGIAVSQGRTAVVQHQELLQRVSLYEESQSRSSLTDEQLSGRLGKERDKGKRIVFTNGVFDILHTGHVHFLREAKKLGDVLVVAVNTDRSARSIKGKNRPINSERDRLALVAALDPVDHVLLFDEDTPANLIRKLRPDIHVKGGDYAGSDLPEAQAVEEIGGRVAIVPLFEALREQPYSTTSVIDRILQLALDENSSEKSTGHSEVKA